MEEALPLKKNLLLLFSIFIIAICGLVYELIAGALSSYLLGDSIYQFSIVIGIFMSSMGLGSFLSRFIEKDIISSFILVEIILGIVGGLSSIILFFAFSHIQNYTPFLFLLCISIGTLIGFEIPLIIRILKNYSPIRSLISNVMTVDYIGALFAAILFPLILVPKLGLIKTAIFFGILNIITGSIGIYVFFHILKNSLYLITLSVISLICMIIMFNFSSNIINFMETSLYSDNIIFSKTTPYQKVVITKMDSTVRMYINGSLQFCSQDEHRYHEALIHPAMSYIPKKENILILGGGDGMAAREILKYSEVKKVTLVDLDKTITDIFKKNTMLQNLNSNSLNNNKMNIINTDALKFLEDTEQLFDLIVIDLPDPHSIEISKLYSKSFYKLLSKRLSSSGAFVTQSTSPLFARKAFWCIYQTIKTTPSMITLKDTLNVIPYHVYVPSFGEWGFIMASNLNFQFKNLANLKNPLKFLDNKVLKNMVHFPQDMSKVPTKINTVDSHILINYYEDGWSKWFS